MIPTPSDEDIYLVIDEAITPPIPAPPQSKVIIHLARALKVLAERVYSGYPEEVLGKEELAAIQLADSITLEET